MPLAYVGNLPEPSNQDQGDVEIVSVLYENQIPQVPDFFYYTDQNTIEIPPENFNTANFFQFRYNRLTRLQSQVFDLGANFLNYEWYLDVCAYVRKNLTQKQELVTEQLVVRDGFEAILQNPADINGDLILTRTNGVITEEIPRESISFINRRRISVARRFFSPNFIYTLTYRSIVIERNPTVSLIYEYRTAISPTQVLSKEWKEFKINDIADTRFSLEDPNNKRYIQFRVTANNIKRVEDLHIYSITARGIPSPQEDIDVLNADVTALLFSQASGSSTFTSSALGDVPVSAEATASLSGDCDGAVIIDANANMMLVGDADGRISRILAGPASSSSQLTADPVNTQKPFLSAAALTNMELSGDSNAILASQPAEAEGSAVLAVPNLPDGAVIIQNVLIRQYDWNDGIDFASRTIDGSNNVTFPNINPSSGSSISFTGSGVATPLANYTESTSPIDPNEGIGVNRVDQGVIVGNNNYDFTLTPAIGQELHNLNTNGIHARFVFKTYDWTSGAGIVATSRTVPQANSWDWELTYTSNSTNHEVSLTVNWYENGGANVGSTTRGPITLPSTGEDWLLVDVIIDPSTSNLTTFNLSVNGNTDSFQLSTSGRNGTIPTEIEVMHTGSSTEHVAMAFFGWREYDGTGLNHSNDRSDANLDPWFTL